MGSSQLRWQRDGFVSIPSGFTVRFEHSCTRDKHIAGEKLELVINIEA